MHKPNPSEFKAPLGYRMALVWSWLFFVIMFCVILASDLNDGNSQKYDLTKVVFGCISILLILGVFLWNHISQTIKVDSKRLYYSSLFKSTQIPLKEIKGYRSTRYNTVIVPHKKEKYKKVKMTKNFPFNEWLTKNLTYLGLSYF